MGNERKTDDEQKRSEVDAANRRRYLYDENVMSHIATSRHRYRRQQQQP